ncbi:MAG TPA: hypothetical protein VM734_25410 [Kofleriaceae bacterium]|nr:hypothetical protein [Kofleriaceae bacterium]
MATSRIAVALAAAVVAIVLVPAVAAAQPGMVPPDPPAPPAERFQRFHVGVHGGLRITGLDEHAAASRAQLDAYGWPSVTSPVLHGYGVDAEYLLAPLIDVGLAWSWARGEHAAGTAWADDRVRTDATLIGAVARLHWSRGRPFIPEPRVDVGLQRVRTVVHATSDTRTTPYLRAGIDWRLGTRRGGVVLAVGYTITGRAPSGALDLATGGLDLDLGPYLRF